MAKSSRLPFILSHNISNEPLAVIHSDLWGPAPISSVQKYHYYVIFIDECIQFTWFFPLKHKSDFYQCFVTFHKYVETQFDKKIRIFQSDGGGEFNTTEFHSYLASCGIKQQLSCLGTPEQNGFAERKHRNITELGLTMLFHGNVPKH
ncbi:hypothetical protein ACH5RR_023204 [Cinchona calisaya]|uniref:Integrase catalytic domain-containing protein n=1 Tax=Cinchona calisaya TaxID=153742 RepID=A0ABD2ZDV9_9GENT